MTGIDEVIEASCQCLTCNYKFRIKYDPPITWELYTEYRDRKEILCEKCNTPCSSFAIFEPEQPTRSDNEVSFKDVKSLSVLEAKRKHKGTWRVLGKIVTVSNMYVIEIAANPPEIPDTEYKDAKSIQLEDIEKLDDNERLDIILYNDDIVNVVAGEIVEITGTIELHDVVKSKRQSQIKMKRVVVNATSIKYVNRKELIVTSKDVENIYKFASYPNLTKRLTAMFAPNVIGHNHIKLGVLRSIVGGHDRGQRGGGRVNTFLVGDPGTAKSTIGQEAAKIKPNSRHVSAPHASSKTITALADKENETVSLKLGAIPLARGAICAIDEITAFPLEEQGRLLSVLEEGEFPLDKHGERWIIPAPTTIIATANPIGSRWSSRDMISIDEIAMLKTVLDRFQQVYYFRDDMDKEQIDVFVNAMSAINKRKPHNYNFLKKYIICASGIEIKTITPEAELMLNQFWKDAKIARNVGVRMYVGLYSIAQAHAKLHLKDIVDADVASKTIEQIQMMMVQTGSTVNAPSDPRIATYDKFKEILQNSKIAVAVSSLCEIACKENPQITSYLGKNWLTRKNYKLRSVVEMLRNHSQVKEVGSNPLVFQWIEGETKSLSDASDVCDAPFKSENIGNGTVTTEIQNENQNENKTSSHTSYTSHRVHSSSSYFPPKCYRCNFSIYETRQEYEYHCVLRHRGKPAYPGPADIKEENLTPQGMPWET